MRTIGIEVVAPPDKAMEGPAAHLTVAGDAMHLSGESLLAT